MSIITLTTDYGTRDGYVAAVKGVILGLAKKVELVDVTHDVAPFDVRHGAFVLRQVWSWFAAGTVHLVVVDPGVGSARRLIVGQYEDRFVVAPDNGLITFVHRDFPLQALHVIENPRWALPSVSSTFHGRDLLAPAAAHLANGVKPREFGRPADRVELLPIPSKAEKVGGELVGCVLHVDRFGTLITNVRADQLSAPRLHAKPWEVSVNGTAIGPVRKSFHEAAVGELVAFVGSSNFLEIAVNQGRAVERFGSVEAIRVEVRP